MLSVPELLLCEQGERYNDQAAADICCQGWVEIEQQPIGDGHEENTQSVWTLAWEGRRAATGADGTDTDATEAKTGLVQVTRVTSAVIDTARGD